MGHLYTVRFSFWGRPTSIIQRAIGNFKSWQNESRTFSSKEQADQYKNDLESGLTRYGKVSNVVVEHIDMDKFIDAMRHTPEIKAECSDESLINGMSY